MRAPASLLHRRAAGETPSSPAPQRQQMAPMMAVDMDGPVIPALLLCMLIGVVFLAILSRCSRRCHRRASSSDRGYPPPPKGLWKMAINALPTVSFAAAGESSSSSSECVICLAEFAQGEGVRVLPRCGHGFHVACIDAWLCKQATCPSCRVVIIPAPTAQVVVAADSSEEAAHTSIDQAIAHG